MRSSYVTQDMTTFVLHYTYSHGGTSHSGSNKITVHVLFFAVSSITFPKWISRTWDQACDAGQSGLGKLGPPPALPRPLFGLSAHPL